jgi:hypothetical protein
VSKVLVWMTGHVDLTVDPPRRVWDANCTVCRRVVHTDPNWITINRAARAHEKEEHPERR